MRCTPSWQGSRHFCGVLTQLPHRQPSPRRHPRCRCRCRRRCRHRPRIVARFVSRLVHVALFQLPPSTAPPPLCLVFGSSAWRQSDCLPIIIIIMMMVTTTTQPQRQRHLHNVYAALPWSQLICRGRNVFTFAAILQHVARRRNYNRNSKQFWELFGDIERFSKLIKDFSCHFHAKIALLGLLTKK